MIPHRYTSFRKRIAALETDCPGFALLVLPRSCLVNAARGRTLEAHFRRTRKLPAQLWLWLPLPEALGSRLRQFFAEDPATGAARQARFLVAIEAGWTDAKLSADEVQEAREQLFSNSYGKEKL